MARTEERGSEILVVSYYFPPITGAPAWRPFSWARFFNENDVKTTILTRHWTGKENTWEEHIADSNSEETFEENETYNIYRLPSKKYKSYYYINRLNISILRKIYFAILQIFGFFNTEVNAYLTFKKKLIQLIRDDKFDTVIFTGPPPNIYRLVNIVRRYSHAKVILDFRDLSNNALLAKAEILSAKWKVKNTFFDLYETRWMNKADLVTTVAPAFQSYLQKITRTKVEVVYNGYDNDYFDQIEKNQPQKFTIAIVGAIYPLQNYKLILEGLHNFLAKNIDTDIQVNGIGILMIDEVGQDFKLRLNDERVYLSARVSKQEAVRYVKNAHCLLFTAWDDRPGMIPAKIYDYLASETLIINCPGDNDFVDWILSESGAGITLNEQAELEKYLYKIYLNWKHNQPLVMERKNEVITQFSRKNQAKLMVDFIRKLYL